MGFRATSWAVGDALGAAICYSYEARSLVSSCMTFVSWVSLGVNAQVLDAFVGDDVSRSKAVTTSLVQLLTWRIGMSNYQSGVIRKGESSPHVLLTVCLHVRHKRSRKEFEEDIDIFLLQKSFL